MATISIHNVVRIESSPIRQYDGFCSRKLVAWSKPIGSSAEQAEEVVLFGANRDALWLGHVVEDGKPVEIVQASLVGVPEQITKLEADLRHARFWVEQYGRALAKVANAGLRRGALAESIKVAEDVLGDELNYYASLNGEEAA